MFVLQPKPTFKADVTIPSPDGEGKIKFEFKHKGRKALAEFLQSLAAKEGENEGRSDADALSEIVADWSGVDTKFSLEALEQLLDAYPTAAKAIFDAYLPAMMEGRVKNSGK